MSIINKQQKTITLTSNESTAHDIVKEITTKRAELKAYFQNTWASYGSLFSLINSDDAYFLRPEPLRHPLIFYFGHTATFFINKLLLGKFINQRINKRLEAVCAVGVDEMSWDDLNSDHYDWPSVDEVRLYRQQVANLIENLIDTMTITLPIAQDSVAWVILMGIEHERIHLETTSVIIRMLDLKYLTPNKSWFACKHSAQAPLNELVSIPQQSICLGKSKTDQTYGWDNEYGQQKIGMKDFSVAKYLVSNQEFLLFINVGGYQTDKYWTEEGKQWLAFSQATMPHFWRKQEGHKQEQFKQGNGYIQRNLCNEIPLPLNWPVEVNYLEAKAFCNWKNEQTQAYVRLPTEAEWACLREKITVDVNNWQQAPGNINLEYYASPCPVDEFETQGIFDIIGNVWQWTESAIDGYEGFSVHPLYDDFSTPTFDGQHNLIKGGSWISTGNEATKHARYAFRRHFFQHAGFRYISTTNAELPITPVNSYETNFDVCQQIHSHYGANDVVLLFDQPNYQQNIANSVKKIITKYNCSTRKLLDLGCSVGRTTFELANYFDFVDGVDFSARYIQYGAQLQQGKNVRYVTINEGNIVNFNERSLARCDLNSAQNILFSQGDASNLKTHFTDYDVIVAQHVLENHHHPKSFLTTIYQRLNSNGMLILLSDYQFDESKTDKIFWLGGKKVNGENVTAFDELQCILSEKFSLLEQQELPRILKINQRKSALSRVQLTVWQKNK